MTITTEEAVAKLKRELTFSGETHCFSWESYDAIRAVLSALDAAMKLADAAEASVEKWRDIADRMWADRDAPQDDDAAARRLYNAWLDLRDARE